MLAIELFRSTRHVALRALALVMPVAMAAAVVATREPLILDVLAGFLVVCAPQAIVARLERRPKLSQTKQSLMPAATPGRVGDWIDRRSVRPTAQRAVVAASERALSGSARLVAFTAAGFVLVGLLVTGGLPNPRDARPDAGGSPGGAPVA